jgi:DNA repair protein RadC
MTALGKLRRKMRGIPRVEAVKMIHEACVEYLARKASRKGAALSAPQDVADFCRMKWGPEAVEVAAILALDSRNRVIEVLELSRGTVDRAAVFPREVARQALRANAAALIFVHNHPSGNPEPSDMDRALTREIGVALHAVGVRLLDHVVVGEEGSFSFKEHGLDL